ncbi:Hypothetical predicted protein [Marmota monax]|uniref:Uncharacterized protein n=1 Tax=Marmota monax TaxID=9995 RepID=A0A5E4D4H7_MARMO|nr:Hypothetical predicted protein [Marmota monax]
MPSILALQVPNAKKLQRKEQLWEKLAKQGELPRDVRRAQARLLNPPVAKSKPGPKDTIQQLFYDLWAPDNPLDKPLEGQDAFFLEPTKKKGVRVRRGRRLGAGAGAGVGVAGALCFLVAVSVSASVPAIQVARLLPAVPAPAGLMCRVLSHLQAAEGLNSQGSWGI